MTTNMNMITMDGSIGDLNIVSSLYEMAVDLVAGIPPIEDDPATLIDSIEDWSDLQTQNLSESFALHHMLDWQNKIDIALPDYSGLSFPLVQETDYVENGNIAYEGVFRAIKTPSFTFLGIFTQIKYSEYVMFYALPFIAFVNLTIGPWKVFRQSVLWISGYGTFDDIWTVWWSKFSIFWTNMYLQITVPLWLLIQIFGVPIEIIWFLLQLGWWMLTQSWNFFHYNVMIWWELIGALYAISLYVNYKNADFLVLVNQQDASSFWWSAFGVSLALVLWPLTLYIWWIVWIFILTDEGWCWPDWFCYSYQYPTGAILTG